MCKNNIFAMSPSRLTRSKRWKARFAILLSMCCEVGDARRERGFVFRLGEEGNT